MLCTHNTSAKSVLYDLWCLFMPCFDVIFYLYIPVSFPLIKSIILSIHFFKIRRLLFVVAASHATFGVLVLCKILIRDIVNRSSTIPRRYIHCTYGAEKIKSDTEIFTGSWVMQLLLGGYLLCNFCYGVICYALGCT